MNASETFLHPLLDRTHRPYVLTNVRTGHRLASTVETAFDSASRRRGLLGRRSLADGSALIIAPCNSIHMFFMRFAIDVAFLDRQGRVLKVRHSIRPWRISAAVRALAALEMPVGTLQRTDTRVGDVISIDPS